MKLDISVNTIVPIENPINLPGHNSPLKACWKFLTEVVNRYDIGIPQSNTNQKFCFKKLYFSGP
jgi:hypothetical protein